MAELEVAVCYRTTPAKVGLWTMGVLMPVWAIGVPFLLGLWISQLVINPLHLASPLLGFMLTSILVLIPVVSVIIAAFCEDDRVVVSKEGLAFPLFMLPALNFKRERLWSDLSYARLSHGGNLLEDKSKADPANFKDDTKTSVASVEEDDDDVKLPSVSIDPAQMGRLELGFHSGGVVHIDLNKVKKEEIEQLLLALEVWGSSCQRSPDIVALHNLLQDSQRGLSTLSYTQMWEEELSRRFSATSFIPLEPKRKLQKGSIEIVRQLAFGGLSAIYLAQRNEQDLIVLKEAVVPPSADEQARQKAAELFDRESLLLKKLDHPQIAKVHDHFVEEGRNYLVLDYIRGIDLRQLVKQRGRQPEDDVLQWGKQIATILVYLHEQKPPIIHRDLTPDNLVKKDDNSITLIDFGAANEFVGTATGTLVGKQAYIAPEQLRGKASLRSDIYALGGTLFFLLTGKDPEPLSASHPKEEVDEVSEEMDGIVAWCTEMEQEDRPARASDLLVKLAELIDQRERAAADLSETAADPETAQAK